MVFMSVGDNNPHNLCSVVTDIFKIGDDIVHSEHVVIRKHQPCIYNQDLPVVLVHHHVFADLAQATNGDDA